MDILRDVLIQQKRELEGQLKNRYISRSAVPSRFANDMIKVVIGPRRAGKSFFCTHFLKTIGIFGYVNFDDDRLADVKNYDDVIEIMNYLYDAPHILLLDEIQNVSRWELLVNRLQRQGYNLVLTGSNSNLLSKELATHLTGRHYTATIFPFSFKEYLSFFGKDLTTSEIKQHLSRYLIQGGYPEPLVKNLDYRDYLATMFDAIVYKDIVKRFKIKNVHAIDELAKYLISNFTCEFSYTSIGKTLGISVHTVQNYTDDLEEAFLLFKIPRFSWKVKSQISTNKKVYCIDNGFIHAKAFKISPAQGRLYENIVAISLKQRELAGDINLFFWKNEQQEEVDFVIKNGTEIVELIQVCYDIAQSKTKERELRALLKASDALSCNNLTIITEDLEANDQTTWNGITRLVHYIPLWKWLI
jgi:predicted AAA+ superfamily ATPase